MNETWQRDKGLEEDSKRSMSDAIKQMHEDLEAAEWVREHGGLEQVKMDYEFMVGLDEYQLEVARKLGLFCDGMDAQDTQKRIMKEIDERESLENENERLRDMLNDVSWALGLGRDVHYYSDDNYKECHETVMNELRKRLMPEGMAWPRYEDGELLLLNDEYIDHYGNINRAAKITFGGISGTVGISYGPWGPVWYERGYKFKHPSVTAGDYKPLEVGQTVWNVNDGREFTVSKLPKLGEYQAVEVRSRNGSFTTFDPDQLTNTKPELDSWEKWREEFIKPPCVYCRNILGVKFDDDTELDRAFDAQVQDMERRAKALAERGE